MENYFWNKLSLKRMDFREQHCMQKTANKMMSYGNLFLKKMSLKRMDFWEQYCMQNTANKELTKELS